MNRTHAIWPALLFCLSGCISFHKTSTGDFDFGDRFRAATDSIMESSRNAEREALKNRATVSADVEAYLQRHFAKANELVSAHTSKVRAASGVGFAGFFDEYGRRRRILLDFTLKLTPSAEVVESKLANATAFPTGKVLVTRPLAEAFDTSKDGYDSVLLGVLLHELIHVRDGHALEQWATADGRSAWARDQVLAGLSAITAIIPFFSLKYDIEYPLTFGAAKELPTLSEFSADLGALSLMDANGFDSSRYVAFLSQLAPSGKGTERQPLRQRVNCLGEFSRARYQQPMRGVLIGSERQGDKMVATIDFPTEEKVASLLASPEQLAKEFTDETKLTDAERKEILVSRMRKWMFMSCALRHTFPKAKLQDGILPTPAFDSVILLQYE
jgi:hypothetical protein